MLSVLPTTGDSPGRTERDLNQRLLLLKKSSKISEETYKLLLPAMGSLHDYMACRRFIYLFIYLTLPKTFNRFTNNI